MIDRLLGNIELSPTPFHAVKRVSELLEQGGFTRLNEREAWKIQKHGKYYAVRSDSSLIAFTVGERFAFNIVAAHTDSPCLKLKGNPDMFTAGLNRLNAEVYGGPILSTFMDRRLKICGRAYYDGANGLEMRLIKSPFDVLIPNLAVHLNREVNNGVKINPQVDMCPVTGINRDAVKELLAGAISCDLYAVCAEKGYTFGSNNELMASPRLDDLAGVYGALEGFLDAEHGGSVNVLALLDCEEIGSMTRQGAASTFLRDMLERIGASLGKTDAQFKEALAASALVSLDNAHAKHPNHPELSDPTTETLMGGGIAIKHHANYNYTTDAVSTAHFKKFFAEKGVKAQDFYMRSDLRCGGTLGAISSAQVSVMAIDIGIPQLAMHSAMECAATSDYIELIKGMKAFFSAFKI